MDISGKIKNNNIYSKKSSTLQLNLGEEKEKPTKSELRQLLINTSNRYSAQLLPTDNSPFLSNLIKSKSRNFFDKYFISHLFAEEQARINERPDNTYSLEINRGRSYKPLISYEIKDNESKTDKASIAYSADPNGKNPITGEKYPTVPEILKKDIKTIKPTLFNSPIKNKKLQFYVEYCIKHALKGDSKKAYQTSATEVKLANEIVESENKRQPDLNLMFFANMRSFFKMIEAVLGTLISKNLKIAEKEKNPKFATKNILAIFNSHNRKIAHNYYAVDIMFNHKKPPSFIFFGRYRDNREKTVQAKIKRSMLGYMEHAVHPRKAELTQISKYMHQFETDKKTGEHSFIHALSNALKLYENRENFTKKLHENPEEKIDIPADFFEHAESPRIIPDYEKKKDVIIKSSNMTLEDHLLAYQANQKGELVNTSISAFRIRTIKNTAYYIDKDFSEL